MEIRELRGVIDSIDALLLDLINHRCKYALQVDGLKQASQAEVYDPVREQEVLANLLRRNPGPLPGAAIEEIFTLIISACRQLQEHNRK